MTLRFLGVKAINFTTGFAASPLLLLVFQSFLLPPEPGSVVIGTAVEENFVTVQTFSPSFSLSLFRYNRLSCFFNSPLCQ